MSEGVCVRVRVRKQIYKRVRANNGSEKARWIKENESEKKQEAISLHMQYVCTLLAMAVVASAFEV